MSLTTSPKITVLMAVYNSEKFVKEAISSVLDQTYKDFELLIIDDASTDSSASILRSFHDERIRIITHVNNHGLTKSLNRGLQSARGEYIARLDADDICLPDRLSKQLSFLEKNPNIALVGSWVECIDEKGNSLKTFRTPLTMPEIKFELLFGNAFVHSSIFFRKDSILAMGGYNENFRYAQDFELYSRLIENYNIANTDEVLVKLRLHSSSVVVMYQPALHQLALDIIRSNISKYYKISEDEMVLIKNPLILRTQPPWMSLVKFLQTARILRAIYTNYSGTIPNPEKEIVFTKYKSRRKTLFKVYLYKLLHVKKN